MTETPSSTPPTAGAIRFKRTIPDAVIERVLNDVRAMFAGGPAPPLSEAVRRKWLGSLAVRKPRKPTLVSVAKQVRRAGINPVRIEMKSDGSYVVDAGKSEPLEASNPWLVNLPRRARR